jgi:hypothetical protein
MQELTQCIERDSELEGVYFFQIGFDVTVSKCGSLNVRTCVQTCVWTSSTLPTYLHASAIHNLLYTSCHALVWKWPSNGLTHHDDEDYV